MENQFRDLKRLNHLVGEIDAVYHEMSLRLSLSDSAMKILYTICNFGEACLLADVCRLTGLSKQTINSAIRKLEGEGILTTEAEDGRAKRLRLTEQGERYASDTALRILLSENEVLSSWPREDVETYLTLMERFLRDLREKAQTL